MGPFGFAEIAFIFVLALLIFGPKKLPEIGRTLGRGMAEFRKATGELTRSINTELALEELPSPARLRSLAFDEPDEAAPPPPEMAPALTESRRVASPDPEAEEPR